MAAGRYLDWLGGRSDRPPAASFHPADRQRGPRSLDQLELHDAVLVGHDASAPEALDLALTQPDRVGAVVLFNTYYGHDRALHLPEFMAVMADSNRPGPDHRAHHELLDDERQRLWLLYYQAREMGPDPNDPEGVGAASILPEFFPPALPTVEQGPEIPLTTG